MLDTEKEQIRDASCQDASSSSNQHQTCKARLRAMLLLCCQILGVKSES